MAEVSQVQITMASGIKTLTWDQYLAMPAAERTELVLDGKVRFMDAQGMEVRGAEALKAMKDSRGKS